MIYFALILSIIPAILQLITPGTFEPHDLHHLADIHQMFRAFQTGQIPPRLGPDFTFGYGYPLFNFYYPAPFYLGAFFYTLVGSLTESMKLIYISIFLVSAVGMYKFLKLFFDKLPSIVGAILFVYTPYRAVQVFVRGAMGEAMALAFFPLVSYFIIKAYREKTSKSVAFAAIFIGIFLLIHNYMWFLSLPWIYLLILSSINYKSRKDLVSSFKALFFPGILGIGIASYWLFPGLLEQKHIPRLTPFLLEDHFPFIKQLILPSWGYGSSHWGPYDEISFQIGIVNITVLTLLALLVLIKRKKIKTDYRIIGWVFLGFLISFVFMNIRTLPLWQFLPFYNFIQFPWRLLYLTTFFSSIAAAVLIQETKKFKLYFALAIIITSILLTTNYFQPSKKIFKSDSEYLNLFFKNPQYSEDYLLLSEWSKERGEPFGSKFISKTANITNIINNKMYWSADVKSETDTVVTFQAYYFPGWFVKVDGQSVNPRPGDPYGQILIDIPAGQHSLEVYWSETNLRLFFDILSLVSIGTIIYLLRKK